MIKFYTFNSINLILPARFDDARQVTLERLTPEANTAEAEATHVSARAATLATAIAYTDGVLPIFLTSNHGLFGHRYPSLSMILNDQ